MTYFYFVIGGLFLVLALHFHHKAKRQQALQQAEQALVKAGAVTDSCKRHGMVIEQSELKPTQKNSATYYDTVQRCAR